MTSIGRTKFIALLVAVALASKPSLAHGGEEHGDAKAAAVAPSARGYTIEGTSDSFELVVKLAQQPAPGQENKAQALLAEMATNAPVPGAQIQLDLSGPESRSLTATAAATPGVYDVAVPAMSAGSYDVTASVVLAGHGDDLVLSSLEVGARPAASAAANRVETLGSTVKIAGAAFVVALVALTIVLVLRRGRGKPAEVSE